MEFTVQEVMDKEQKLKDLEVELEEALLQQREAKTLGDFSENSELAAATALVKSLQSEKSILMEQLSDYTIVRPDKGPRITIGSKVLFHKIENGEQVGEDRSLRLASEGDTIDKKTLSVESPLGKAILNGTDGIYTIQTTSGVRKYYVRKEQNAD